LTTKQTRLTILMPPELVRKLDEWRRTQAIPAGRSAAVRVLVEKGLAEIQANAARGEG
jgi:metal-responsive CopG/Arc/MetJ family transcriptional regulator